MTKKVVKRGKEAETFLNGFRQYKNESDDNVIKKIILDAKTSQKGPKLNKKTVKEIMEARERVRNGEYHNEEETKRIFGL